MDYVDQWNRNRVEWLYQLPRSGVSSAAVHVGLLFATFFQPEEREILKPGYDWIMKAAGMCRGTVAKALAELEREGFLEIDRMHRYRNEYRMPFDGDDPWVRRPQNVASKF